MRLSGLLLCNWERFDGANALSLEAKAYSVVARHERDPERSNWLGKSSLTRAIRFVLYGDHPYRTEDEWITRGRPDGQVSATLLEEDPRSAVIVERSRLRGKSTQLRVILPGGEVACGPDAQAVVERILGLRLLDYEHTCEFEQGKMARLVTAKPEERMGVVGEWLEMAPLERAAEHNAQALAEVLRERDSLADLHRAAEAHLAQLYQGWDADGAKARLASLSLVAAEAEDLLKRARERMESAQEACLKASRNWDYQELVAEGKRLAAEVDAVDADALQATLKAAGKVLDAAQGEAGVARKALEERVRLRTAGFDGQCPVTRRECPAREQVDEHVRQDASEVQRLRVVAESTGARLTVARTAESAAREAVYLDETKCRRLEDLRESARKMVEGGVGPAEPLDRLNAARAEALTLVHQAEEALRSARLEEARQRDRIEEAGRQLVRIEELAAKEKALADRLATLSEAALILGRNGAQRRISEPFLAAIGDGANEALQECGVGLTVGVQWEHEGKDPARACAACGFPFPDSRKVKACGRCGAARGRNIINRLEFPMSADGGAARDLAGIALQLSAAEWLRGRRGAAWRVACLDEPLAQCDRAHRRVMTKAFAAMLTGRFGFEQAFIISHSPETQAALPGTILVTADDERSRVEVVA
jgi:hypothetical protein